MESPAGILCTRLLEMQALPLFLFTPSQSLALALPALCPHLRAECQSAVIDNGDWSGNLRVRAHDCTCHTHSEMFAYICQRLRLTFADLSRLCRYLVTWKHPAACGQQVTWRWQYTVNIVAICVLLYFVGMFV